MILSPSKQREIWLVAAVSVLIQGLFLFESSRDDPTFRIPIVDAGVYHDMAARFASDGSLSDDVLWQPPLFPLVLGCLYRLVGANVVAAKLFLVVINAASCALTCWLGTRAFSRRVGITAGLVLAAYGPFVFLGSQLLPAGLALFLNLLALCIWARQLERPSLKTAQALGLVIGLAIINVPNAVVLVVMFMAAAVVSLKRKTSPRRPAHALLAFAGVALAIAPVTLRNYLVAGAWVPISTHSGINLYIGNNEETARTLAIRPGDDWQRLARTSYENGESKSLVEQDAYFRRQARDYIVKHPIDFAIGLFRKTFQYINSREIPRNIDPYVFRDCSRLLSVLMWRAGSFAFPLGLIAPLAVVGIVASLSSFAKSSELAATPIPPLARGDEGGSDAIATSSADSRTSIRKLLVWFIITYSLSVILVFVSGRYRLPIVPAIVIFASAGSWCLVDRLRGRDRQANREHKHLAPIFAGLAAAIIVNLPVSSAVDLVNFKAEMHMCVGSALIQQSKFDEAEAQLRETLRLQPDYPEGHNKLARALELQGKYEEAEELLRKSIEYRPDNPEAYRVLAEVLRKTKRTQEALDAYRRAVEVDPTSPDSHAGLADLLMELGDDASAQPQLEKAVRLNPTSAPLHHHYAELLLRLNRNAEAIDHFKRGMALKEPSEDTLNTFTWTLATCPDPSLRDCQLAIQLGEQLVFMTHKQNPIALDTLAAAYAECGRMFEAVRTVRRALEIAKSTNDGVLAESILPRLDWYESKLKSSSSNSKGP